MLKAGDTVTIEVTQPDIDSGVCDHAGKCAIANAACRQFSFPNAYVNGEGIDLQSADCKTIHELSIPPEAVDFMDQFDAGQPVKPFSFQSTVFK